jgi:NAD(P)-dependent dehydrogenase (short-subunit alcohol dehydrogenase family)
MPSVLVTSSSRGIGREFVRQYAAQGWQVLAACRHPEAVADDLRALGPGVRPVAMDVTDLASVEAAARQDSAPLDLLINSAGVIGHGKEGPGELDFREWSRVLDVNTFGPVRVLDAFVDHLAAAKGARAIALTSGMGSIGDVGSGRAIMYRTSKAALNMAMRTRAFELKTRGIVVAVINPGWVRTDMGGSGASISPEESVTAMRGIIERLTLENAGSFLNWRGGTYPW